MCDYSLHDVASRPAKVGDKLVSTQFPNAITRGFADPTQPRVAVCLLPGTELAFEQEVECDASFRFLPTRKSSHKVARFRQVNLNRPAAHHDALEFPDGKIVLVTDLCEEAELTGVLMNVARDASRLSACTIPALHAATMSRDDDVDLAALVNSASHPGLKDRITTFRQAIARQRSKA